MFKHLCLTLKKNYNVAKVFCSKPKRGVKKYETLDLLILQNHKKKLRLHIDVNKCTYIRKFI